MKNLRICFTLLIFIETKEKKNWFVLSCFTENLANQFLLDVVNFNSNIFVHFEMIQRRGN